MAKDEKRQMTAEEFGQKALMELRPGGFLIVETDGSDRAKSIVRQTCYNTKVRKFGEIAARGITEFECKATDGNLMLITAK